VHHCTLVVITNPFSLLLSKQHICLEIQVQHTTQLRQHLAQLNNLCHYPRKFNSSRIQGNTSVRPDSPHVLDRFVLCSCNMILLLIPRWLSCLFLFHVILHFLLASEERTNKYYSHQGASTTHSQSSILRPTDIYTLVQDYMHCYYMWITTNWSERTLKLVSPACNMFWY